MLGASQKVKIVVGAGGAAGVNPSNNANGARGQDGSAVIEYMQK